MTDSVKKSEVVDLNEVVDLDFNDSFGDRAGFVDGDTLHSGRTMIAVTASKIVGLSLPETDSPFLPLIISRRPVHHRFRTFTRLSKSSGLSVKLGRVSE